MNRSLVSLRISGDTVAYSSDFADTPSALIYRIGMLTAANLNTIRACCKRQRSRSISEPLMSIDVPLCVVEV